MRGRLFFRPRNRYIKGETDVWPVEPTDQYKKSRKCKQPNKLCYKINFFFRKCEKNRGGGRTRNSSATPLKQCTSNHQWFTLDLSHSPTAALKSRRLSSLLGFTSFCTQSERKTQLSGAALLICPRSKFDPNVFRSSQRRGKATLLGFMFVRFSFSFYISSSISSFSKCVKEWRSKVEVLKKKEKALCSVAPQSMKEYTLFSVTLLQARGECISIWRRKTLLCFRSCRGRG